MTGWNAVLLAVVLAGTASNDARADGIYLVAGKFAQVTMGETAPLSLSERQTILAHILPCWNVGLLSPDALVITVVVAFAMAQDGRPETGSIRMLSSSGGSEAAARQAFEAARRAIIRCGANGFDLPAEKYGQWQSIEITFNPENMRIK